MNTAFANKKEKQIGAVVELEITRIMPNKNQPRREFNRDELCSLAKSIAQDGILQPLTVRRRGLDYELISGERRLRAAKLAGFSAVPCIVMEVGGEASAFLAIVENLQRQDLSYFEEAAAIASLIKEYGCTQDKIALRLGISQSTVANKLRLLKLSDRCRDEIMRQGLTERHARALLKLDNDEQRLFMLQKIEAGGLNVEKTEQVIAGYNEKKKREESVRRRSAVLKDVKLFMNTVNRALEVMKLAGVECAARETRGDGFIEYTVRISQPHSANV